MRKHMLVLYRVSEKSKSSVNVCWVPSIPSVLANTTALSYLLSFLYDPLDVWLRRVICLGQ